MSLLGSLAAGHAAAITGTAVLWPIARRHGVPIAVAGFEPLDVLAALARLLSLVRQGRAEVANVYPRAVSSEGNRTAQARLWQVFEAVTGRWRGIGDIPGGNLRLREAYARADARRRFAIDLSSLRGRGPSALSASCRCGDIMAGMATPTDCRLFGHACTPASPVGACMVSSEGSCRIWHTYGASPDLSEVH